MTHLGVRAPLRAHRERTNRALAAGTLAVAIGVFPSGVAAQSTGVPAIDPTAADYVGYAVDDLPDHFLTPGVRNADNTPVDNPITNAGAELGRVLFYDARLSHNNGVACASCHTQETGFADPAQFSVGFEGGLTGRHSMGLSNAKYYNSGRFFWDERAASLEEQVLMPIQDSVEMGSDLTSLVQELSATEFYPVLFQRAYGDSQVTSERIAQSLAQFVRSMVSYQSPFDRALEAGVNGEPDFAAVPEVANPVLAARGHDVFGQACAGCHRTDAQVSNDTHNIGLPVIDANGDGQLDVDPGAGGREFKAPSLRNIALRGRFMHDGRFQSLQEVIDFYSTGIQAAANLGVGLRPGGFNFSDRDKAALLAFLRTLTDEEFLSSELFSNPLLALLGDYDLDGQVDADDLDVWRLDYGQSENPDGGPLSADANGDGLVNAADYTIARDRQGDRWDDAWQSVAAAAPEPAGVAMLLTAAGFAAASRRSRRGRAA